LKEAVVAGKRELIDTGTDKRYVRRDEQGRFVESDDVGRSLSQDIRRRAKSAVKSGSGDKGDRKR
jgi:predicted transcriptional regulator